MALPPSRSVSRSSFMRASNSGVGLRMHVVGDAGHARPARQQLVPARGEGVDVVRHLDLPRQGGGERDHHLEVGRIVNRDVGHRREHDGQPDDAARRAQALLGHDRLDLGVEAVAELALEAAEPEPEVVAVAGEHVVPGGVALRGHAVGHALVFAVGAGHALSHGPLHQEQRHEHRRIGDRQRAVDLGAQHDHVEDDREQDAQIALDLVEQVEIDVERLAGEKRLDPLARLLVAQKLGLVAVVAGKAQHVAARRRGSRCARRKSSSARRRYRRSIRAARIHIRSASRNVPLATSRPASMTR